MKKFFKIVWKSLLGLAVVAVVFIGVAMGNAWYDNYNSYYNDTRLSDNVTVRYYYRQREYKVYNRQLDRITLKDVDKVVKASEGDSLTVFFREKLRGFLDVNTGYEVIPAQYKHAWVFSEGLAAVVNESGKIGFINKDNEVVLPFVYDYRTEHPIDYLFQHGQCVMTDERGACGIIDKEGNWLMEPRYDCIWDLYFDKYRIVKEGEKYGMIDENLNFVFPIAYDCIEFTEAERSGVLLTRDNIKQQVALDGTIITLFVIDGCNDLYYTQKIAPEIMHNGDGEAYTLTEADILSDYLQFRVGYKKGVMHRETGKVIIPAQYKYIEMVSPTLFEASLWDIDGSILIDIKGRMVKNTESDKE